MRRLQENSLTAQSTHVSLNTVILLELVPEQVWLILPVVAIASPPYPSHSPTPDFGIIPSELGEG